MVQLSLAGGGVSLSLAGPDLEELWLQFLIWQQGDRTVPSPGCAAVCSCLYGAWKVGVGRELEWNDVSPEEAKRRRRRSHHPPYMT